MIIIIIIIVITILLEVVGVLVIVIITIAATATTIIIVIIIDGKEIQALLIATKDGEIRIIIIIIILQKNLLNSYGDKMLTQQVDGVARIQGLPLPLVAV